MSRAEQLRPVPCWNCKGKATFKTMQPTPPPVVWVRFSPSGSGLFAVGPHGPGEGEDAAAECLQCSSCGQIAGICIRIGSN